MNGLKAINVMIDIELFYAFKEKCKKNHRSMRSVIIEALTNYVNN